MVKSTGLKIFKTLSQALYLVNSKTEKISVQCNDDGSRPVWYGALEKDEKLIAPLPMSKQ